ncbi:uncharacterized protein si:cabz01007794.1 isoform X4 [Gadus macrocephalus]|uniref:uncharacterized protein si:cabz01007794.1 isoform X4 n=1 Tax=Gadus macrocephalus TaxID=80720 RepID=UPI0028CBBB49|nr:uncharacterized protein si:cabz01007794.1 isoform X4 [Gadus macrocephalus]
MGQSLLFSLLLALTIVPKASIQNTTMSSTTAGSTASTPMMSSTAAGSTASTTIMSLTTAGSTASTAMMSSTAAGSTASTTMESSTTAGSTASTPIMSSVAAGSTASTTIMSLTTAGSTASTAMMSSTAAGSTASTTMESSTTAGSTASTPIMSSVAAGSTASTTMVSSAAAGSTASTTMSPISNAGCGSSLLCAGEPESCNPSMAGSCFFVGTKRTAGQNFEFSLSGESEGYIGCTLSTDSSLGGGDITFICANNKGNLKFIGASLDNGALSRQSVNANSVKGHINGTTIQCTFKATVPDATARGSATSFALAVVSGTFSPDTDELGAPEVKVQTKVLDIADTNSSTLSILNVVTPGVNSGRPIHQALSEALLIIIATMGLALI